MQRFKVRDLMVNFLPEGGQVPFCRGVTLPDCTFNTVNTLRYDPCGMTICPPVTLCVQISLFVACGSDGGSSCNACVTDGGATTGGCGPGTGPKLVGDMGRQLEDLTLLKQQLKQSLSQVEAQERAVAESLRPQTLDEVQQLEEKLTGALEELGARRAEIERALPKAKE